MCLTELTSAAQQSLTAPGGATAAGAVPNLIRYSSVLKDGSGAVITELSGVTFLIYKDELGGAPLWMETQNVQPDKAGRYTVQLGAVSKDGLPSDVFMTGEARWLAVQIGNQGEQARVALVAVPYAMKAADAQTLGGLPASAFMLAAPSGGNTAAPSTPSEPGSSTTVAPASSSNVTTTGGTANTIPLFTTSTNIQNSILTQTGNVAVNVGGKLNLPATGKANSSKGFNSQPQDFVASVFNGTAAVAQTFQWQTEPVNNNKNTATGTLNLLSASGTNKLAETGLNIASNGQITFAAGQAFPGGTVTGNESVNGNVSSTGQLISTVSTGTAPLRVNSTTQVANLNASLLAGAPASAFATVGANTFNGNQTVNGNLSATGAVTGSSFNIGGAQFAFGSFQLSNAFLGYAGNTIGGTQNTAIGVQALLQIMAGGTQNTATGFQALIPDTTGSQNTASGAFALGGNTTGSLNTAVGFAAGITSGELSGSSNTAIGAYTEFRSPSMTNATAIGANAVVDQSNSMVLGSINGVNGAIASTNVGIGTTTPAATLDVHGTGNFTGLITFAAGQTFPGTGTVRSVGSGPGPTGGPITTSGTLSIASGGVTNSMLANPALTVNPGTDLLGGGPVSLGGSTTLNLDTTKVPQLNTANTFTGNQTVNGNLSATGVVTGSAFSIGSNLFAFGSYPNANALLGFAGNTTMTGTDNTASGVHALLYNTTGSYNSASGLEALYFNTTGIGNTASGVGALLYNTTGGWNSASGLNALYSNTTGNYNSASGMDALFSNTTGNDNTASGGLEALYSNTTGSANTASGFVAGNTLDGSYITGSNNTFLGAQSWASTGTLNNATAIGANALVGENNAMVLGSISGVNGGTADTNVGIGTTAPGTRLHIVSSSTYQPVLVQTSSTFGTWLELANTSSGGHTWNILSSASGNGEGAGNLGITDLTGQSTIWLEGNVNVSGTLTKNGGSFKIDHPLDPANKYLYHSFVESPDMMNIYNGNVVLDANGEAAIGLPDWFGALNRDFRYQLTCIGGFAPVYIAEEISNNQFKIAGGKSGMKISWQVTGIRQDAWANAHRIPVEEEKNARERGYYLHPELYGVPEEKQIEWARHF